MKRIRIKDGLLWHADRKPDNNETIDVSLADRIANQNGYPYAESFVRAFDGKTLTLDDDLKIRPDNVIGIDEQIACIAREIAIRERCYPKWVSKGTMKQAEADRELNRMRAVIETLSRVKEAEKLVANVAKEIRKEDGPGYSIHENGCPYEHGGACTC